MRNEWRDLNTGSAPSTDSAMTRRRFLRGAVLAGLGAALAPPLFSLGVGCSSDDKPDNDIKMGITLGNQVLWRYLAHKKDELLRPLGYNVTFYNYLDGDQFVADFLKGQIDVCATIVNTLPGLSAAAESQLFLPIAWMKSGFPIVAPANSSLRSVGDLQGKKLAAFPPNHPSTTYWESLVRENYGFSLKEKAEIIEYTQLQAISPAEPLRDGKVDAAIVESQALSELLPKGSYRQIGDLRAEWNKYSRSDRLLVYGGYVAKTGWIKANKRFVEDLIRLNYEALTAYKTNRAILVDAATAYAGENAPAMNKESSAYVSDYLGYDEVEPERAYLSGADVEDYKKVFSLLEKTGVLKPAPRDVNKLFYLSDKRPR